MFRSSFSKIPYHIYFLFTLYFVPVLTRISSGIEITKIPLDIGYTVSGMTKSAICSDGKWLSGFQLKNYCAAYGTVNVRITCLDANFENSEVLEISADPTFPPHATYETYSACNSHSFVQSYQKLGDCCFNSGNDVGLNDLHFGCSDGSEIVSGGCNRGIWKAYTACPAQTAGCGYETVEMPFNPTGDNFSLMDLTLYCCPICKTNNGFYLDPSSFKCIFCDDSCFTCSDMLSTNCLSCGASDTFSNSFFTCTVSSNSARKVYDFYSDTNMGTDLNLYLRMTAIQFTCKDWSIIKITNGYIQRTLTSLTPHYKARIKLRIFKIDNWGGNSIQISIDSNVLYTPSLSNLADTDNSLYFGNICDGSGIEDIIQLDQEFSHFSSTLIYKISGPNTFGLRNLKILIYKCDYTCKSCSGSAINQCTACYDHATLSSAGSCSCDDGYLVATTSPCDDAVCTVCNACSIGCKKCTGLSANQCTSCFANYFLDGTSCLPNCASPKCGRTQSWTCDTTCFLPTEFIDPTTQTCLQCDSSCATCSSTDLHCDTCKEPRYLTATNECVLKCPIPKYEIDETHTCEDDCPDSKFKHDIDRKCYLTCPLGYYGNVQTKMCVDTCPDGMWADKVRSLCKFCQLNCKKCSGSETACGNVCSRDWLIGATCSNPSYTTILDNRIFNTASFLKSDITTSGWTIKAGTSDVSDCSDYHLLGGYNNFKQGTVISKTWNSLSPHFRARITFFFMKIDSWGGASLNVNIIDGTIKTQKAVITMSNEDTSITKWCGNVETMEALRRVDVIGEHKGTTLGVEITTTISTATAFWGIYDLSVSIDLCDSTICASCSGPTSNDCLSCKPGIFKYLQNPPGPSSCQTSCPNGKYANLVKLQCDNCNVICKKCDGGESFNCLDCELGKYLNVIANGRTCVETCPSTHFKNLEDKTCDLCDTACLTCSGKLPTQCTSCNPPKFLNSDGTCLEKCLEPLFGLTSSSKCESACPAKYFSNSTTRLCAICFSTCKTCMSGLETGCIECEAGYLLQSGACVSVCGVDHYFDVLNNYCKKCVSGCSKCDSLNTCSICGNELFLFLPSNTSCITCTELGQYKSNELRFCYSCIPKCSVCTDGSTCNKCNAKYYIDTRKQCQLQKNLYAYFNQTELPTVISIVFSDYSSSLLENLLFYIKVSISGLNDDEFTWKIQKDEKKNSIKNLEFNFKKYVDSNNLLQVEFNITDGENDEFIFRNKTLNLYLQPHCESPLVYKKSLEKCINITYVTPILENTFNASKLLLKFTNGYGKIFNAYKETSVISVSLLNSSDFTYIIQQSDDNQDDFNVYLSFNKSITGEPTLTFKINPPAAYNLLVYQIGDNLLEVKLKDIYVLNQATKDLIEQSKEATKTVDSITTSAFSANNVLTTGASFAFKCISSMDIIRFLRLFLIGYPPNVVAMFEALPPTLDLVPNINLEEDSEDKSHDFPDSFRHYGVSIYIFNNNGNQFIEIFVYFLIGLFSLFLFNRLINKIKSKYIFYVLVILKAVFVWGFSLSSFLGGFLLFNLYTFLSFRYPTWHSPLGIFNFTFSIFMGIGLISFYPLLYWKIKNLRPLLSKKSKSNQISPEIELQFNPLKENSIAPFSGDRTSRKNEDNDNSLLQSPTSPRKSETKIIKHSVANRSPYLKANSGSTRLFLEEAASTDKIRSSVEEKQKNSNNAFQNPDTERKLNNLSEIKSIKNEASFSKNILKTPREENQLRETSKTPNNELISPTTAALDSPLPARPAFDEKFNVTKKNAVFPEPVLFKKKEIQMNQENRKATLVKRISNEFHSFRKSVLKTTIPVQLNKVFNDAKRNIPAMRYHQTLDGLEADEIRRYSPFYKDFIHLHSSQSYYLIFDLGRQTVYCLLIVLLYDSPFAGTIILNVINILYTLLLLTIRPFKEQIETIQAFFNEICLLMASMSAMALASMEKFGIVDFEVKMNLGWAIVFSNYLLIFVFLIRVVFMLVVLTFVLLRALYRYIKNEWKNRDNILKEEELENTVAEFDPNEEMIKINKYFDD